MRGEDMAIGPLSTLISGSPPHARGRHSQDSRKHASDWITPACAGKTQRIASTEFQSMDHPRMRGEDVAIKAGEGIDPWITPACAGKTDTAYQEYTVE